MSDNWTDHDIAMIGNGRSLTFVIDSVDVYTISSENPNFESARRAVTEKNFVNLLAAVKPVTVISTLASQVRGIEVGEHTVTFDGREIHGVLVDRILEFAREGFDFEPLAKFLERLMANPSKTAVDELYIFLENAKTPMPITSDGKFLAYKKVRSDYMDIYSGTVRYAVGDEPEMERNQVDDNRANTCSAGLHFCSIGYLPSFGYCNPENTRIMQVEIDPAEVVSIPLDHSNEKGRAARMKVVGELTTEQYERAIAGYSVWNSNFVATKTESEKDEDTSSFDDYDYIERGRTLDGQPQAFNGRESARIFKRKFGGRVVDAWDEGVPYGASSDGGYARWYVTGYEAQVDTKEHDAFTTREQARIFVRDNGGKIVDAWEETQYLGSDQNKRWVVV